MTDFSDLPAADNAMRRALIENWATLPDVEREALFDLGAMNVSPVDRLVKSAEIIYAVADAMPAALKETAAGMFKIAHQHGFHGLGQSNRAELAAKVLEGKTVAEKDRPAKRDDIIPGAGPQPVEPPVPNPTQVDGEDDVG